MALSTQVQATCFLLLLLGSLASGSVLRQETGQLMDFQPQDTAGAQAGLMPVLQRLKRDSHIPICVFCCNCCRNSKCGFCCKT
ncbi:hepcidin [Suricata suricatta]|uniref:Hepcidin antimicrobial peptide n=1 Tax=Suricata suricatta TaxID=37032 RepID=A0A673V0D3_SURSU|nr:hepcidin [Suricata suricatta]